MSLSYPYAATTSAIPNTNPVIKYSNEVLSNKVEFFERFKYRTVVREFAKQNVPIYELDDFINFVFDTTLLETNMELRGWLLFIN